MVLEVHQPGIQRQLRDRTHRTFLVHVHQSRLHSNPITTGVQIRFLQTAVSKASRRTTSACPIGMCPPARFRYSTTVFGQLTDWWRKIARNGKRLGPGLRRRSAGNRNGFRLMPVYVHHCSFRVPRDRAGAGLVSFPYRVLSAK
jgi:hypothetical protein